MDVGIIGSGRLGATAAQLLVEVGHDVAIAPVRESESVDDLTETLGERLRAVEPAEAARFGDVVLLTIPFRERDSLPESDHFADAVVVDAMDPFTEDYHVMDLGDDTSSELVAEQLPEARVVKAFNTMYWETLRDYGHPELPESERYALFLAGDDADAKATVADLIRDIGFGPVDVGGLVDGGSLLEPGSVFYNREIATDHARDKVQQLALGR